MKGKKVASGECLYRRTYGPIGKRYTNPDGTATSRAFKLRPKDNSELSVDVKSMTTEIAAVGNDPGRFLLFEIDVIQVEKVELTAVHDPLEENVAHAIILGMDPEDDIKPGLLAKASRPVSLSQASNH